MDNTSSTEKEKIIKAFRQEIESKLLLPLSSSAEEADLNGVFLNLVQAINSSSLTGDDAAEVFEELGKAINNQPPQLWVDDVPIACNEQNIAAAKLALSFRAERFFRDIYREKIKNMDIVGKMEFISERIEALERIPLRFGQIYVIPALDYLNGELEREFERRRRTVERRDILIEGDHATSNSEEALRDSRSDDLPEMARILANNCLWFERASQETKQRVWGKLVGFSRNQWALFFIESAPKKNYDSMAEAVNGIVKPNARLIEKISGLTNMSKVVIDESRRGYPTDQKKVKEVIELLKADWILHK